MKLYRIRNWNEIFENNRSRVIENLHWVPIPNRHDGENFSEIMTHKDGAMIYSAFILMIQIASKCHPRGTLIKDNGTPHNGTSMSVKCRAPALWFETALSYLEANTDWLDVEHVTTERQVTDVQVPDERQADVTEGRKEGIEGTEKNEGKKEEAPSFVKDSEKALNGYQKHPRTTLPREWDFQQLWKKEWSLSKDGKKCMWTLKDEDWVPQLLDVEPDFEKIIEIAKKAWGNPNGFWSKRAITFAGFASNFDNIRQEVGILSSSEKKERFI